MADYSAAKIMTANKIPSADLYSLVTAKVSCCTCTFENAGLMENCP